MLGYDRAICLHDPRYGGVAGPNGGTYESRLGPPEIGEWMHIVATFETGVDSKIYRNDRNHHLADSRVTNNGDGDPQFSIGGLVNYENHHIDACARATPARRRASRPAACARAAAARAAS